MFLSFSYPSYLIGVFLIPLLIFFHFFGLKTLRGGSLKFANFEAIARVKGIDIYSKKISLLFLNVIFVLLLVFSLSGLTLNMEADSSKYSYIILIDSSGSMVADDVLPNRFSYAKIAANQFVDLLPVGTKVGLVSFSGDSYLNRDLIDNKDELKQIINGLKISEVAGTDIYEAILNSINLLYEEDNKAIILFSDGQENVGSIEKAIDQAIRNDIVIHSFGIGTPEGGYAEYGISKVKEDSLKSISYSTQGKYYLLRGNEDINEVMRNMLVMTRGMTAISLVNYLLIVAIIIFIIKQFLLSINKISW